MATHTTKDEEFSMELGGCRVKPPPSINNSTEKVFFYSFVELDFSFLRMPAW